MKLFILYMAENVTSLLNCDTGIIDFIYYMIMYFQLNSQISDLFFDLCYCFLLLLCLFGIFCSIFVKTTFFSSCSLSIQYDFYIIYSTTYLRVARQRSHLLSKSSKFVFVWYVVAFLICCWLLFK